MTRLTVLSDIASRVMHSTIGSHRTVSAGVAIDTAAMEGIRREVAQLPKWKSCKEDDAAFVIDLIASQGAAAAIVNINRETQEWAQFILDAGVLHHAIIATSRKVAGWAKPANLLKFLLLSMACASTTGHALRIHPGPRILGSKGQQLVECVTVCDSEIDGDENLEVFESFWAKQHIPKSRLAALGIEVISSDVRVATEQLEPALLLADYVAGLGLAAATNDPGRLPLPLSQEKARLLLSRLRSQGKLLMIEEDFSYSYDEIFGEVMVQAREYADAFSKS